MLVEIGLKVVAITPWQRSNPVQLGSSVLKRQGVQTNTESKTQEIESIAFRNIYFSDDDVCVHHVKSLVLKSYEI